MFESWLRFRQIFCGGRRGLRLVEDGRVAAEGQTLGGPAVRLALHLRRSSIQLGADAQFRGCRSMSRHSPAARTVAHSEPYGGTPPHHGWALPALVSVGGHLSHSTRVFPQPANRVSTANSAGTSPLKLRYPALVGRHIRRCWVGGGLCFGRLKLCLWRERTAQKPLGQDLIFPGESGARTN